MSTYFEDYSVRHALRREITELYISVAIKNFGVSMISLFEPIYLYDQLGFTLAQIMFFYAIVYTLYLFLLPIGGKICARFGFEHSILYSVPVIILYYGSLYAASKIPLLIVITPILLAAYKMLFWPAYHANFARYGSLGHRGKEIGRLGILTATVVIVGPVLGGLLISLFSFHVLFVIVVILMIVSVLPLFTTKEVFKPSDFGYWHAFQRLIKKKYRRYAFGFIAYGEEIIRLAVWPIFVFLILGSYVGLGGLSSLTILLTAIVGLFIGQIVDREGAKKMLSFSTIGYVIVWFLRLLVGTISEAFMVDGLSRIFSRGTHLPIQVLVYDKGSEHGNLNFAVLFEMAVSVGKLLVCWLLFVVFLFTQNMGVAFILAGFISLLYLSLK